MDRPDTRRHKFQQMTIGITEVDTRPAARPVCAAFDLHAMLRQTRFPFAEPVAIDQDEAGAVLLVTLGGAGERKTVTVEERRVGRTRIERHDLDVAGIPSQPALIERLAREGDPDLILDVRLTGVRPDGLDLDVAEVEAALAPSFLRARVRDRSVAALPDAATIPPDTMRPKFEIQNEYKGY